MRYTRDPLFAPPSRAKTTGFKYWLCATMYVLSGVLVYVFFAVPEVRAFISDQKLSLLLTSMGLLGEGAADPLPVLLTYPLLALFVIFILPHTPILVMPSGCFGGFYTVVRVYRLSSYGNATD